MVAPRMAVKIIVVETQSVANAYATAEPAEMRHCSMPKFALAVPRCSLFFCVAP
jgi:hypothetical protein